MMPKATPSILSRAYWRMAAAEFKSTRTLLFAALMIALRVVFKSLSIPVAADLRINTAFFVNALGAMVFGPVVAAAAAAVTDTLGCLLFPSGPYFFPFIFVEIAGSMIFALMFYRRELTVTRVTLSRFLIDFGVNIVLQTPIMMLYYQMVMGRYYAPFDMVRIVKNLALFPVESVLLTVFLRYAVPPLQRLGFVQGGVERLRFTKRNIVTLTALTLCGVLLAGGYAMYHYEHTSLSASYSAQERLARNRELGEIVLAQNPELDADRTVTIIESAYPKLGSPNVTYTLAVYQADEAAADEMETIRGYSKSKAKADERLRLLTNATAVLDSRTGQMVSYAETAP